MKKIAALVATGSLAVLAVGAGSASADPPQTVCLHLLSAYENTLLVGVPLPAASAISKCAVVSG